MSARPRATTRRTADLTAFVGAPASFWVASMACLAIVIGSVAPWSMAYGFMSFSGTRMHGWNEIGVAGLGLAMLGAHRMLEARLPLLVAAVAGALGAIQAVGTLTKIGSDGSVTVFGIQYRFLDPAWGLYLVLAGTIALACSAALTWLAARPVA